MCNLNIFIKSHKKNHDKLKKIISFLEVTTTNSFLYNNDGDGFYFDYNNKLIKSEHKINLLKYSQDIKNSNFILSHQRLATHGLKNKYIQPFKNNDFIFLHNGILSGYTNTQHSDSYLFFNEFYKAFLSFKDVKREDNIIKALQLLLNEVLGSFSICVFDIKTNILYYVKSSTTQIYFYRNKDLNEAFLSTKDNKQILNLYDSSFIGLRPFDYKIYKFFIKEKKILYSVVGNIKPYTYTYLSDSVIKNYSNVNTIKNNSIKGYTNNFFIKPKNNLKEDNYLKDALTPYLFKAGFKVKNKKNCWECGEFTRFYNQESNKYYCANCFEEEFLNYI